MTVDNQRVDLKGVGVNVGRCLRVFYADDGIVVSRDSKWLQHSMNVFISLLRRYGLADNIAKSCTMKCQPRALSLGMSY